MKKNPVSREKSLTATILLIIIIAVLFFTAYIRIDHIITKRCIERMEEGVNTVTTEISNKFLRDSRILNAAADILSASDNFDVESLQSTLKTFSPLLETMRMQILMPDNTVIGTNGRTIDATGSISFQDELPLGEHVSNRMTSLTDSSVQLLRHFVPIVKDGKTIALLYGVTHLDELPNLINISNIYNANASVYIIDNDNGDFIMDTWHETLGNITAFDTQKTKKEKSWDAAVQSILKGETGYVILKPKSTNKWMYLYYAPTNINNWSIGVSIPNSQAFNHLYAIRKICIFIALIMAIAVIVYYLFVRKNAKKSVERAVERAVLEEKLKKAEAAEKAKTIFLSNMSHDIRTPMNAIIGFTTLAQTNIDNKNRVQEYLRKIMSSSNHLLSLINDILDMSRIESGHLNIEEKECTISDIFRDMRNIIQTQMQSKQLNFFMDTIDVIDEDIYCDKLHLNQILLNLLGNAIKFTPSGGSVALTVRQKPDAPTGYGSYEIRVKDTGIGMSKEFAEHIFEPFERERTSTVSGIQGTGLGMAITKSIVDAMGGTIELVTEQNKGSEFIVCFAFRLQSGHKEIGIIEELEGLRALVVDDNFNTCDSVTKMLSQLGMRPEWSMHGKEALLRVRQALEMGDKFYIYIIDWALPDLNGLEVVRQIRTVIDDNIPIIILTAYDWSMIEEEAREAGVTAFCNKPIFLSELRDTLIHTIEQTDVLNNGSTVLPDTSDDIKGSRLLLVEDNELNREIAQELLTESGFLIETAIDGSIAVKMVEASEPGYYDLILMDVQMPIMDGYAATRAIRALDNKALANIPIIAMTANAFASDKKAALDSGMNAHVAKPINIELVINVINTLISKNKPKEL